MKFEIHQSNDVIWVTRLTSAFLAILFVLMVWIYLAQDSVLGMFFLIITLLSIVLTPLIAGIYAPTAYRITSNAVYLDRIMGPVKIKRSEIASVEEVDTKYLSHSLRTWGSGGMFGYYGYFWSKKNGTFFAMSKSRKNLVLIKTKNGKKFIISPMEPDEFIDSLKKVIFTRWRRDAEN